MRSDVAYRLQAAELVERAKSETNSILVAEFEALSRAYLRLAEQAEHNAQAYEPPPTLEDPEIKR